MSSYNELSSWKLDTHLPTDTHSIHNALIMRVSCDNRKHQWPLLVDPQHQAEKLVLAVQKGENHIDTLELLSGTVSHVTGPHLWALQGLLPSLNKLLWCNVL